MKFIIGIFILLSTATNLTYSQDSNIGQFAIWKVKEGMSQNFENGYKKHLEWHKENNDPWNWYGWYIVSGERLGQFVDATFDHSWGDFDKAINPSGDRVDNKLHVVPFAEVQTVFKIKNYPELSFNQNNKFDSKLIKLITIELDNIYDGLKIFEIVSDYYKSKNINSIQTCQVIDGGNLKNMIILVGFNDWKNYGISENIALKIFEAEKKLKLNTIKNISSETMIYREDLSLFSK